MTADDLHTGRNNAVFATANGTSLYEGLLSSDINPAIKSAASKIRSFTSLIEGFKSRLNEPVPTIIRAVLEESGYQNELVIENTDDSKARLENLEEFINKAVVYQNDNEEPTLSGFLEEVALIADIDNLPEGDDYVLLMTLHGAKGLEFDTVYIAGMEDGLFPGFMAITASDGGEELAEERRLFYVGITRARKNLTLTLARTRMVRGEYQTESPSRFLKEISPLLTESNMPTVSFSPKKEEAFEKKLANVRMRETKKSEYDAIINEAVQALVALGYSQSDALKSVNSIELTPDITASQLLKEGLKHI